MPEQRITELEIKVAFLEDTIESLNQVITEQDQRILRLEDSIKLLYAELKEQQSRTDDDIQPFDPMNEIPPHY